MRFEGGTVPSTCVRADLHKIRKSNFAPEARHTSRFGFSTSLPLDQNKIFGKNDRRPNNRHKIDLLPGSEIVEISLIGNHYDEVFSVPSFELALE